jgi:arylsulfatase A-like enzyme
MQLHVVALLVLAVNGVAAAATKPTTPPRPHLLSIIVDDLGGYDTQVNNPAAPTPTIGALATSGIRLNRHYVYMYCSPTR